LASIHSTCDFSSIHHIHVLIDFAASEALFVTGDFSRLFVLVNEPLTNARSFEDKLHILNNLIRALAGKDLILL